MRHGRAKAARKTLQHFARTVGLRAPYWILLDATFVASMFQQKLPVKERMDRILQTTGAAGPNKYCITKVAVDELQLVHQDLEAKQHEKAGSFQEALQWIRRECIILNHNHQTTADPKEEKEDDETEREQVDGEQKSSTPSPQDDILLHIENDERPCVVASQDEDLLHQLRRMGTVPIVRLANGSVLLLENPSKQSQYQFQGKERKKWKHSLPDAERALVKLVKQEARAENTNNTNKGNVSAGRARNKAKGPNPLSCKRRERPGEGKGSKESAGQKRRSRAKKQRT